MEIGVFSDIHSGILQKSEKPSAKKELIQNNSINKKEKVKNILKAAAPIVIPLFSIPITAAVTYKLTTKNMLLLKSQITSLSEKVNSLEALNNQNSYRLSELLKKTSIKNKKANAKIWSALLAVAGLSSSYKIGQSSEEITKKIRERIDSIDSRSNEAIYNANDAISKSGNSLSSKYTENDNGIILLKNFDSLNKNIIKLF